jgi:predicted nuclease with RNAse H fold
MTRTGFVAAALLLGYVSIPASVQVQRSAQASIDAYKKAIRAAEEVPSGGRLEAAFNAIGPVRTALLQGDTSAGHTLEAMPESEFVALRGELGRAGLEINRVEVLFVEPDVPFFRALASRGDRVDRAFFDALQSTYPESIFPVYVHQQTDFSGCTRFGSGTLVSTYLTWSGFRRAYPAKYEEASSTEVQKVAEALTDSTCACGDAASVEQELSSFISRAPVSAVRSLVEQRLAAFRSNPAIIRFGCKSG